MGAIAAIVAASSVSGCSSVLSRADEVRDLDRQREGLVYWLPKRDIVVTVTVKLNEAKQMETEVAAAAGPMQPDYESRQFLIDYLRNPIGTNHLNIAVNPKGLIGKVTSETTVKLSEVLAELAKTSRALVAEPALCGLGTYQRFVAATHGATGSVCNFQIKVCRLFPDAVRDTKDPEDFYSPWGRSGIYYRQELPYRVEVAPAGTPLMVCPVAAKDKTPKDEARTKQSFLVFSPSESPTYFLPVRRTLFANNKADFDFSEGVPTKYDQSTDGELIGLLKLPADVIGAYFGAMGEIFKYRKQSLESEQQLLAAQAKLAAEIVKLQACKDAVNAGVKGEELKAVCGGS